MRDEDQLLRELRVLEKCQRIESGKSEGIAEGPLAGVREIEAGCNRDERKKIDKKYLEIHRINELTVRGSD